MCIILLTYLRNDYRYLSITFRNQKSDIEASLLHIRGL